MKINQPGWQAFFITTLAGVLAIALTGCSSLQSRSGSRTVQIDLRSLLNARVVFTQSNGRLQPADHSLDHGDSSLLITQSAMEISQAGQLNPLPDAGFFPANHDHPDVQLPYGVAGSGPQVHQSRDRTETYAVTVPPKHYGQMQLFFISADGPTPISVRLQYADGSSDQRTTVVPDFYFLLTATNQDWFVLAEDFGKVNRQGRMTESVHHFIHGFNLNPDTAKELRQIEITKENSKSVLNLFGVTGKVRN